MRLGTVWSRRPWTARPTSRTQSWRSTNRLWFRKHSLPQLLDHAALSLVVVRGRAGPPIKHVGRNSLARCSLFSSCPHIAVGAAPASARTERRRTCPGCPTLTPPIPSSILAGAPLNYSSGPPRRRSVKARMMRSVHPWHPLSFCNRLLPPMATPDFHACSRSAMSVPARHGQSTASRLRSSRATPVSCGCPGPAAPVAARHCARMLPGGQQTG